MQYNKRATCIITLSKCGNVLSVQMITCIELQNMEPKRLTDQAGIHPPYPSVSCHLSLCLFLCVNTEISFQVVSLE